MSRSVPTCKDCGQPDYPPDHDAVCVYQAGVRAERSREISAFAAIARLPRLHDKYGVEVITRDDVMDILTRLTHDAPTPARPAQEPARQGEALPFLAWVYEVSPGQHALLTEAEVRRIGLPAYSINGPMPRPLPPAAKEK